MKACVLTGIRKVEIAEVPDASITSETDVLLRIKSVGVCGSDVHYYTTGRIGSQVVQYPFAVGHECSGIVEQVGRAVTNVRPGDRVAVEPAMPCFVCDQCKSGRPHTCRKLKFLGCPGQTAGCLSVYICVPHTSCMKISESMSFDAAAFSEPFAIGMYAVRQAAAVVGARIGIFGAGPIGLSVLFSAKAQGTGAVYMTDRLDYRVAFALRTGASWAGNPDREDVAGSIYEREPQGLDVAFECCGQQEALNQAIEVLRPGGTLLIVGIPEFDRFSFSAEQIRRKEITIRNIRRQNGCAEAAVEAIAGGQVPVADVCTHSFSLEQTGEAFEMVAGYKSGVIKAMIHI
jgi:L-iditol 2-dehydrogenase